MSNTGSTACSTGPSRATARTHASATWAGSFSIHSAPRCPRLTMSWVRPAISQTPRPSPHITVSSTGCSPDQLKCPSSASTRAPCHQECTGTTRVPSDAKRETGTPRSSRMKILSTAVE
jgi:hypothetical protein